MTLPEQDQLPPAGTGRGKVDMQGGTEADVLMIKGKITSLVEQGLLQRAAQKGESRGGPGGGGGRY